MNGAEFRELLATVASAWISGDTASALVLHRRRPLPEPPDTQHYEGRDALFEFFGGDDPPLMQMAWHTILFDEDAQMGAAEYTYTGTNTYHGVVVWLRGDRIANWREYQHRSELDREAFTALNPS